MSARTVDAPAAMAENRTYDELAVGDTATLTRALGEEDIELFAAVSGDTNPAHLDKDYAAGTPFRHVIAHGMWGGALISAVLGTELPGPGTIYLRQSLSFRRPVSPGDTVRASVTVAEKREKGRVALDCSVVNSAGEVVITGEAEVIAPREKVRRPVSALPQLVIHERGRRLIALAEAAAARGPLATAAVHPVTADAFKAVMAAHGAGVAAPLLVGPVKRIKKAAKAAGADADAFEIVDAPHSHAAAAVAAQLAAQGRAGALLVGALALEEVLQAASDPANGLVTERRASHAYVIDAPAYAKPLILTDARVNIAPDLRTKRDIVQNAVDLARALGVKKPKTALLAASAAVDQEMPSTVHAAALCKMADRGQITGCVIDGPLGIDAAVAAGFAESFGGSAVAGDADVLVAPNLEAADLLAKQLDHLAGAVATGVVLGFRAPIAVQSDGPDSAVAACAAAALAARKR